MIEPRPEMKPVPEGSEPILQVGIVLEEDRKTSVTIRVPDDSYSLVSKDKSIPLQAGKKYLIENKDFALRVSGESVSNILVAREPICIRSGSRSEISPQSGIEVDSIVAGRSFHWRKEIVQTLPGALEIHPTDTSLLVVNIVGFEDYLTCVVASEMSPECPDEFLIAQGVSARSWAYAFLNTRYENRPYTICNDDNSQRYQGTTHLSAHSITAMKPSRGLFLVTAEGNVCPAYYSKGCGGHTERPKDVFGFAVEGVSPVLDAPGDSDAKSIEISGEDGFATWLEQEARSEHQIYCSPAAIKNSDLKKYLGAVDVEGSYFRWKHVITAQELIKNLRKKFQVMDVESILDIPCGNRGISGRIFKLAVQYRAANDEVKEYQVENQYDIRRLLHESFLFSSAFSASLEKSEDGSVSEIHLEGAGWGHGVGLCQIGALGMALQGKSQEEILLHYYPGCHLNKAYD